MKLLKFIFLLSFFLYGRILIASTPDYHEIEKDKWEKAVDGKNYVEEPPEEEENDLTLNPPRQPFAFSSNFFTILIYVAIAALLIFLLFWLFGKGLFKNTKVQSRESITINDLEERPMESDLERFLREAMEAKDYRLAIRIYYLMVLRSLQDKGLIRWKKDKTNFDYLLEVASHPQFHMLSNSTIAYEFIWYGEKNIAEQQFDSLRVSFTDLIQKINGR